MAHGFTQTDGAVFTGKPAWHGLGKVVYEAPTPSEALKLAGLDWEVEQWPLSAVNEGQARMPITSHVCNIRSDTKEQLGVVGVGYSPVQNRELAQFAEALSTSGDNVAVESAASICGGRKVWFLLRGNSFLVKGFDDAVHPYLLLANGHDGGLAFHVRPTSIRVVCKNTLSMSLGARSDMAIRFRHEGNVQAKLDEARRVLGMFDRTTEKFREKVNFLSSKTVSREELQRFFVECYTQAFEPIPTAPTNKKEREARDDAMGTIYKWGRIFERDSSKFGASMWTALNSATDWIQHEDTVRGKDHRARLENRVKSQIFGTIEDRTNAAAKVAMSLAG
jgi:phage/plasmid-like protein (TIGR03299 family)